MDRTRSTVLAGAGVALGIALLATAGDLNPPAGPVAPTFATLDEVEPRRSLSQADLPIVIQSSGSYHLVGDLIATTDGVPLIRVTAPDVTIDFRGHTIQGASLFADASAGVLVAGGENLTLFGGTIRDCAGDGVGTSAGVNDVDITVRDMRILNNGAAGIDTGGNPVRVEGCTVSNNADGGIASTLVHVRDCMVRSNGSLGIGGFDGLVVNCVVVGHDTNIALLSGVSVENRAP